MPFRRLNFLKPAALLAGGLLSLSACIPEIPQTTLAPKTSNATAIFNLFEPIFWTAVVVFFIVEALLFYSVFRFRSRDHSWGVPEQLHGNTSLEIGWTIIPAVILGVIFFLTLQTLTVVHNVPAAAASGPQVNVRVVGHQWWWEFQYPDYKTADGQIVSVGSDMHVPAGAVVNYTLESVDVIHSFWAPQLGGKMDLVPGHVNRFYFVAPKETGEFAGQCAEFCGAQHANMRFHVMVDKDFSAWIENQKKPAAAPATDKARQGAQLFATAGCLACHNAGGVAAVTEGKIGPNLTHLGSRTTIAGGSLPLTKDNLSRWLHNPDDVKPGNLMAGTMRQIVAGWGGNADANIDALVEYLTSLK
ncbi:MAG: cytochrome c oxidase subunit II [Chloroflexi bacterium]|nr:cytochrome c oxidase subunit II [Chloroflexota bacterium]